MFFLPIGEASIGKLVHVIVPKCQGGAPCELKKGEIYGVEVDYVVGKQRLEIFDLFKKNLRLKVLLYLYECFIIIGEHNTQNLTAVVQGVIGGIPLPWNGVGLDACADMLIGRCPLEIGDYVTYAVELEVLEFYPTVS